MFTIMGATGHTGGRIAESLLGRGKRVRAIGRNPDKLELLARRGAEVVVGDVKDVVFLTRAFAGAEAVYTLIPPNLVANDLHDYFESVSKATVRALRDARVRHVVNLSSLGAHLPERMGPVVGLHEHEQRLNTLLGVNLVHLRPTYFMENLLVTIPLLKQQGIMGTMIKSDIPVPVIATTDIATSATDYLLSLDFKGHTVRELRGPADMTMNDMASMVGQAVDKPGVKYVQFSYEDGLNAMIGAGVSANMASSLVELSHAINDGLGISASGRTPASTTPTPFSTFASEIFAPAYRAAM
jgi:uncharacterized protein YbjT (DUF2867 family)